MTQSRKLSHSVVSIDGHDDFNNKNEFVHDYSHTGESENGAVEIFKEIVHFSSTKIKSVFSRKTIYRRLPILTWIKSYSRDDFTGDIMAGVTVGLTIIPQALAYSNVAGLPPQYGLYSSFLGVFLYIFLGSCKDVPMGPTAIVSLLTYQTINGFGVEHAILLCLLCGIIEFLMGIFGLGFIIDFVSEPVSSGFTSAVALIIVGTQIKDLLGITVDGSTFVRILSSTLSKISYVRKWDLLLGLACITFLLSLRFLARYSANKTNYGSVRKKWFYKIIWCLGMFRNAILVIICMGIGYCVQNFTEEVPFKLTGHIPSGLPSFQVPKFSYHDEKANKTYNFIEMCNNLGSGLIVVPLLSILENIAICKAFSNGKAIDVKQELMAIGICNICNSFFQSFPGTGSIARSAVNNSSGVRTPLGGLYTSMIVIIALMFFTPCFSYIPKASLAAIIIAAVIFMVEVNIIKPMWRSKKSDLILGILTFLACLMFQLEIGILIGIGINLFFILHHAARPQVAIDKFVSHSGIEYLMITPDRCLIFPSVEYVRNLVTKHSIRQGVPIVLDCTHIYGADFTAAKAIESLKNDFGSRNQLLLFYNVKPSVVSVFQGLSLTDFNVFYKKHDLEVLLHQVIRSGVTKL